MIRGGLLPTASVVKVEAIDRSALHPVFSARIASIRYRDDYNNFNRGHHPLWMVQSLVTSMLEGRSRQPNSHAAVAAACRGRCPAMDRHER
jgi:hypothetical protein